MKDLTYSPELRPTLDDAPRTAGMLGALNGGGKHVYAGTVPPTVKAQRRAKSKRARVSRRQNRKA